MTIQKWMWRSVDFPPIASIGQESTDCQIKIKICLMLEIESAYLKIEIKTIHMPPKAPRRFLLRSYHPRQLRGKEVVRSWRVGKKTNKKNLGSTSRAVEHAQLDLAGTPQLVSWGFLIYHVSLLFWVRTPSRVRTTSSCSFRSIWHIQK